MRPDDVSTLLDNVDGSALLDVEYSLPDYSKFQLDHIICDVTMTAIPLFSVPKRKGLYKLSNQIKSRVRFLLGNFADAVILLVSGCKNYHFAPAIELALSIQTVYEN